MTAVPPPNQARGAKLAQAIVDNVVQAHQRNAATETQRKLQATMLAAQQFHQTVGPALAKIADALLEVVPDDHPMRPLLETLATKAPPNV